MQSYQPESSMEFTKHQITVKGKIYGYWTRADGSLVDLSIRSEDNPSKTPYLKDGSVRFELVLRAIRSLSHA